MTKLKIKLMPCKNPEYDEGSRTWNPMGICPMGLNNPTTIVYCCGDACCAFITVSDTRGICGMVPNIWNHLEM